jgi:hypothetical protein
MHTKFKSEKDNVLPASMEAIYDIARAGEAHTIDRKLVKHCATGLAACTTEEKAARKIQILPLSKNMTQRRIKDCGANVLDNHFEGWS